MINVPKNAASESKNAIMPTFAGGKRGASIGLNRKPRAA